MVGFLFRKPDLGRFQFRGSGEASQVGHENGKNAPIRENWQQKTRRQQLKVEPDFQSQGSAWLVDPSVERQEAFLPLEFGLPQGRHEFTKNQACHTGICGRFQRGTKKTPRCRGAFSDLSNYKPER
jgi:hypothetical protein